MKRVFFTIYILLTGIFAFPSVLRADADLPDSLMFQGDLFHAQYDFDKALEAYGQALEILEYEADSLKIISLKDKILLSENGRNMSGFAYNPYVVAKHKFSLDDFYLYYFAENDFEWNYPSQHLQILRFFDGFAANID
jgi:hypothetical protein